MEGLLLIAFIIWVIYMWNKKPKYPETTQQVQTQQQNMNQNMICPHCNTKGSVTTKQVKKKVGVSGGKAAGAVLTCGLSLFVVGLSRKQQVTEASCSNCGMSWSF